MVTVLLEYINLLVLAKYFLFTLYLMLLATYILCLKLCWHNQQVPSETVISLCCTYGTLYVVHCSPLLIAHVTCMYIAHCSLCVNALFKYSGSVHSYYSLQIAT